MSCAGPLKNNISGGGRCCEARSRCEACSPIASPRFHTPPALYGVPTRGSLFVAARSSMVRSSLAMTHFRQAFEARVSELLQHPRVRVTHYWMGPPASEAALAAVESALGPLPPSVRAFYAETNGVQLRWIDCENPAYSDGDESPMRNTYVWGMTSEVSGDGLIDIGPVESLLQTEDPYEIGDEVRAFDTIDDIGMVAFARGKTVTTRLRIGSDHNTDWDDVPFEFSDYLELLVDLYGHANVRKKACFGKSQSRDVALASLLRPAPLAPSTVGGAAIKLERIMFADERYSRVTLRGTASSFHPLGNDPTSLVRVRTDLGEEIYLARRRASPLTDLRDAYELAREAPGAFLTAMAQVSPAASRGMFGSIWGQRGNSHVRHVPFPIGIAPEAWRVFALFSTLDPHVVVAELGKVLSGWLLEAGSRARHEHTVVIMDAAETLTAILARTMPRLPPAPLCRQLTDLAKAADAFGASFSLTPSPPPLSEHAAYWRSAISGTAIPLLPPISHKFGTSVGLEALPLLD